MSLGLLSISTLTSEVVAGDINEPYFILENGYADIRLNLDYGGYFDEEGYYHFGDGNQLANSSTFTRDFLENFLKPIKMANSTNSQQNKRNYPSVLESHQVLMAHILF